MRFRAWLERVRSWWRPSPREAETEGMTELEAEANVRPLGNVHRIAPR